MKNLRKLAGIIFVTAIIVCAMAACDLFPAENQTPKASDYNFSKMEQTAGTVTAVTITPKDGKSPGARTIYYAGTDGTVYTKSTTIPQAVGTYAVTFDVAEATGWNKAEGLSAGELEVTTKATPVAADYTFGNLTQETGSVTAVTITPKTGKSTGNRTIYYAATGSTTKSETIPQAVGTYTVTFDVAVTTTYNAATGLSADNLTVTKATPKATDYTITGPEDDEYDGTAKAVTIEPKTGKSAGNRTIYYKGISPTTYEKSQTAPTNAGTYEVTFDVAAKGDWNKAEGLEAGELEIDKATPVASDYTFGNQSQTANSVTAVTITAKTGKSGGTVSNIKYAGSATIPQAAGTYAVTFDVAAATNWYAKTGLSAGNLNVTAGNQTPKEDDYTFGNLSQVAGSVTAVTITAKTGKSGGTVSDIEYAGSATIPQTVGTYAVTFKVAAVTGWNGATVTTNTNKLVVSAKTISVDTTGSAQVGGRLEAIPTKNFTSGTVTYQWYRDSVESPSISTEAVYFPGPIDAGKHIFVKVSCDGLTAQKDIQIPSSFTYTVKIEEEASNKLIAKAVVNDKSWPASAANGFTCKWYDEESDEMSTEGEEHTLATEDYGTTITVKVSGHGHNNITATFDVPAEP